jgi:signal transduction histidine kinase
VSGTNTIPAILPSTGNLQRLPARLALAVRQTLPRGLTLPPEVWARRHRAMVWLLWLHAIGLGLFAYLHGHPLIHSLGYAVPLAVLAGLAGDRSLGTRARSGIVSVGLLTASALLIHTSGGLIEMHFHFFVMIAVIALYEDWIPYLIAFAYVVVHHGLMGVLDPAGVYNHPDAAAHPWKWAAIHGIFVVGAGTTGVIAWRMNEEVRGELLRKNLEITLLGAVAAAANEASTIDEALRSSVKLVCNQTGWPVGHALLREGDVLVTAGVWYVDSAEHFHRFRTLTESMTFAPSHGLPGRVLESGRPAWITQTVVDPGFPRAAVANECGIVSAFAFPVRVGSEVVAVLEFFSQQQVDKDAEVLELMDRIGTQLGRVFERMRAEDERKRYFKDRERLLTQERQQVERLRELDRLKDDFVASVSHELRTPLTSIRGYLELLHDGEGGPLTGNQREFLTVIDRNADRLLRLVGDLLDVAQIDGGQIVLERERVALAAIAEDAVEGARAVACTRGIDLISEASAAPFVHADPSRLAQVVDNLVSNALKFTPTGGTVRVRVAAEADRAVLTVSDTGMGIPKDEQARLFERFFRANAAGERAIPGTGLGLWITKTIVDAHEGAIAVTSEAGSGTTFVVELPLAQNEEAAHPGPTLLEAA